MSITEIISIILLLSMFISLVIIICYYLNEKKNKQGYRTGVCLAVGKLKRYVQEHNGSAEQIDKVFRAIECYAPDEDKKVLRSIFYKVN